MNFRALVSSSLVLLFSLHSIIPSPGLSQPARARCPVINLPPWPTPAKYLRPRPPLYPPGLNLMPKRPANNPGPLANRARILFITQELKRNITFDPFRYTPTWVGNNYCLFKGFFCDTVPDLNITGLASIDFNGGRFGGRFLNFYRFIRNLPDIAIFHANSNNFSGIINNGLSQLRYLYELDLSNNKFLGGFPKNVLGAKNLTFVDLRFNTYNGTLSNDLFNFDTDILFINNNGFSQGIPTNLGNTPAIYLTLAGNKLTGTIPTSIGRSWKTLKEVLLLNNRLSGCLPFEIGYLNQTTVFDAGSNLLTGPIPQSFGCLKSMQFLNLAHNQLYGTIPESLCRLPNAYNVTLTYNFFTQMGTRCLRLMRAGRLHVGRNCIMGLPNQKPAAECNRFFSRPRTCSRVSTFSFVPCNLPNSIEIDGRHLEEIPAPPPPRTYAALEKVQN
ncbi:uncharacterized protein At4g06744-like [Humulus lupulus]|uniref:uncharacterized protein At4g06744-like n=1 Tax=Humulus lupulus TaxID=3486 RepID=UPI002B403408|nr:uncharacterized protein At4g06744-like [Humulus lupulus]